MPCQGTGWSSCYCSSVGGYAAEPARDARSVGGRPRLRIVISDEGTRQAHDDALTSRPTTFRSVSTGGGSARAVTATRVRRGTHGILDHLSATGMLAGRGEGVLDVAVRQSVRFIGYELCRGRGVCVLGASWASPCAARPPRRRASSSAAWRPWRARVRHWNNRGLPRRRVRALLRPRRLCVRRSRGRRRAKRARLAGEQQQQYS